MTHVLVVEGSRAQGEAARVALEASGFGVCIAPDALKALELLSTRPFDLILSDVRTPKMSGFELCARLKASPRTRELPVILLIAGPDPVAIAQGLEAGADNFISTPYAPDFLVDRVRKTLSDHACRGDARSSVELTCLGRRFTINSDRQQILASWSSTLEEVVRGTRELSARADELYSMLEGMVAESAELARTKEHAEQESHYKTQLLANMSCEFRMPLNAIVGFAELLDEQTMGPLNERQREFVGYIIHGGRQLLSLIDNTLDLSKLGNGRLRLSRELVSVETLVDEVRRSVQPLAEQQGVGLAVRIASGLPRVWVDAARVKQVLSQLISNGIKFNQRHGSVKLEVFAESDHLCCCVSDTGIGVRAEDLRKLFREFEQIEHQGPKPEGSGLGLALTKRLIELHGGTIDVRSREGHGSTFTVRIPLPPPN